MLISHEHRKYFVIVKIIINLQQRKNMDLYQYLEQLTGYNQLQLDDFYSKLTEKKYSSLLASPFVNSRQLNYWLEEMKLLPEKEERGWRVRGG